jgi:hypothetical protein
VSTDVDRGPLLIDSSAFVVPMAFSKSPWRNPGVSENAIDSRSQMKINNV